MEFSEGSLLEENSANAESLRKFESYGTFLRIERDFSGA